MVDTTLPLARDGSSTARRVARVLSLVGAGVALAFAWMAASDGFAYDAHAYWVADPATAYLLPEGSPDALLYAPPVILAMSTFGALPWQVFLTTWSLGIGAAIAAMAGPFTLPLLVTPPIASEITLGNIHAFIGLAVIAGFRWPGAWSLVLLTKVTPGVGLLWFVFRREWRQLAVAIGVTAAISVPTMVLAPDLWVRWVRAVVENAGGPSLASGVLATPLVVRLALAVALLWWGARRDARWVVPIAVTLGLPVLWDHGLAIALASIWLALHPGRPRGATGTNDGLPARTVPRHDGPDPIGGSHVSHPGPEMDTPLVAVVIPALNEAGKIGRVLDKLPRDPRFEAIVVDDGSTDGTGDEARAHGAALVIRHEQRGGVGAAIRDGWKAGLERRRPYLALLSGDDQHEPAELLRALALIESLPADYIQGSRWMPGGRVEGPAGNRAFGTRLYSFVFGLLVFRRVTDATNGFRLFRSSILDDPEIDLDQAWLTSYDLEPYVLYKSIRRGYRVVEMPCTVRYHAREGYTKMRGMRDWWRLFRPAVLLRFGVKR